MRFHWIILRVAGAVALLIAAFKLASGVLQKFEGDAFLDRFQGGDLLPLFLAAGLVLLAGMLIWRDLVKLAARPMQRTVDSIYGTEEGDGVPPLDYRLARFYVKEDRIEDAIDAYGRILEHYPAESDAYLEILPLLSGTPDASRTIDQFQQKAAKHISDAGLRDYVERAYTSAREHS
jgi:hypothetical protein